MRSAFQELVLEADECKEEAEVGKGVGSDLSGRLRRGPLGEAESAGRS